MKRFTSDSTVHDFGSQIDSKWRGIPWKLSLVALLPTLVALGVVETVSRVEFQLRHGYSYYESIAYVPHSELTFSNNISHHSWRDEPTPRYDLFFIPPPPVDEKRRRIWVLGGSTSAARPDGRDWPTVFQDVVLEGSDAPLLVVNMAHDGYGIGHIRWLYYHYRKKVNPSTIIIFSGWNYRGIVSSSVSSYRPVNACSRFDPWLRCFSALLINHSAAYGRLFHLYLRLVDYYNRGDRCGHPPQPYSELAEWESEYRKTVRVMAEDYRVLLVLFPGLAMRDDIRAKLPHRLRCIAVHFDAYRAEYEARITVIRRIGQELALPLLDARSPYLNLPPQVHVSFFRDLAHQSPKGNRFLAKVIEREFERVAN